MKVLISRKDLRDTASGVPKKVLQELTITHNFNRLWVFTFRALRIGQFLLMH